MFLAMESQTVATQVVHLDILLIDGNKKDHDLVQRLFDEIQNVKLNLDWIKTFQAGLELIAQKQHDAYLVDYILDEGTGLALLREALRQGGQSPIILLTDQDDRDVDIEAMKAGAADYLVKSRLNPLLLERSIRYAIKHKRLIDELGERVIAQTGELIATNDRLKQEMAQKEQLEQQVNEFLKRRNHQVQTSTEIAQEIATAPKLDDLFRQIVHLVQERFNYYHAHVYTLADNSLVMQEGTGEAGKKLKQTNHKISLSAKKSLVAQAARTGKPVLISDVYQEPFWLPNPLLPKTKSELAVPIKMRNEILGVLDVQSDKLGGLGQEDQILLMGLCGQIAVAIHNSRLATRRKEAEENQQKLIKDLDAFAHTVSYNLREPLALVVGYTELVREQAGISDELHGYLNAVARNAHKLVEIIDELQLLTGVRKTDIKLIPLNMARIVAEVQQRLAYLINEHQAKIIISEYWPVALGHKPWVEEVWANYITNAIRYGGRPPLVQIGATAQSDGMIRFWVRDNGAGLSKEQSRMFNEFQLEQFQTKEYGLGFSIVQRIVTKLGGQVGVQSDGVAGGGTIFSFTLPKYQEK